MYTMKNTMGRLKAEWTMEKRRLVNLKTYQEKTIQKKTQKEHLILKSYKGFFYQYQCTEYSEYNRQNR